jgi:hypothetical protein
LRFEKPEQYGILAGSNPRSVLLADLSRNHCECDMGQYTYETERFFDFTPAIRSLKYLIIGMKK